MTTIAYDRPVKDLVAQLSATGHVTHTAYKKTSVTLHHNGGRLSHEGVLNVWRTRKASAHFDSDSAGAIAQFVKVNEYAWATGSTAGNMGSISIEMANSTTAPGWGVAPVTWQSAARLAGWLFAKVIGVRPNAGNFFVHSHWYATACAGPYIHKGWNPIMAEAQKAYDFFKGGHSAPTNSSPSVPAKPAPTPGAYTLNDVTKLQEILGIATDGIWGLNTDVHAMAFRTSARGGKANVTSVRRFQAILHVTVDGRWGPNTDVHFLRIRSQFHH